MAAEMVVLGSRERMVVPGVCTQQRKPLLGIELKLFLPSHSAILFTCCQSEKGSLCPFLRGQKIDLKGVKQ